MFYFNRASVKYAIRNKNTGLRIARVAGFSCYSFNARICVFLTHKFCASHTLRCGRRSSYLLISCVVACSACFFGALQVVSRRSLLHARVFRAVRIIFHVFIR